MNPRRNFIKETISTAAGLVLAPALSNELIGAPALVRSTSLGSDSVPTGAARIRFSVIGMNHGHIYGQVGAVQRGGGELVSFYAKEPDLAAEFAKRFPQAKQAKSEAEILEDKSIQLVLSSAIANERAPLGIRVMKAGKDFMSDKPGITTLEQLAEVRKVQKETKRIYSIMYSERLENKATVKAGELVKAGAIGNVIQTVGLGPHRMNPATRPAWFFEKKQFGGIICDIASHQFDQYLFFTGSTKADIVASQVGNLHFPQYPNFEDFGDVMLRGDGGMGYIRVDWFTPDGLKSWGDGRLTILGTEGFIEIRKNIDPGGRDGGNHLFITDKKETRYIDCSKENLPYGEQLVNDVLNRTETAMSQEHCFLATELAIKAQKQAQVIHLKK
ncbi:MULTISPECIES: Gfo/Idh/MocA family oxidoreductase [unclassified Spirosoma]|uniref:Gfo/Idh/MocA family protein n=1 Tax=unclassified Spirosoma TaxID=2621999 RepID=UPI00095C51B9|nr:MULTISPECIES: Gfo/Idh/MocA family oxidoreductase [unclassified Spirosoma]MBN8826262.1 Gfo/Idh/MocA family oxidoreductase [Spirosoma sp.]OJW75167.1 MAG: oxidoreductase [Spirosoma sp. 48-14]